MVPVAVLPTTEIFGSVCNSLSYRQHLCLMYRRYLNFIIGKILWYIWWLSHQFKPASHLLKTKTFTSHFEEEVALLTPKALQVPPWHSKL